MKVLFVCNNMYAKGNGLGTSARVTMKHLKEAGVEVRMMTTENEDPDGDQPYYRLKHYIFPVFEFILVANSFRFASCDENLFREALEWCDIVHFEEGFHLERKLAPMAKAMGKKIVGTFHVYPENIMYNVRMGDWKLPNRIMLDYWRRNAYDYCSDIQCPTQAVKDRLEAAGYKARLHVISNGIKTRKGIVAREPETNPFLILSVGRLAWEKNQVELLEAMKYSRHSREIKLSFAGCGTREKALRRKADRLLRKGILQHPAEFGFYTKDELRELSGRSYLYIHNAKVEVEGLSCIEALREGTVPVIGKGRYIGTTGFALDERSIYTMGDPKELAARIDWWIEHPEERRAMGEKYIEFAKGYDVHKSISALIDMYNQALKGE